MLEMNNANVNEKSKNKAPNKLERSISGKRAHTTINCNYLPYLTMHVILNDDYPSENQPFYKLSCRWLSIDQLNKIICNNI